MERLQQADFRALLEFLQESYALVDLEAFPAQVMAALRKLVPAEIITYNEVNARQQKAQRIEWDPVEAGLLLPLEAFFEPYIHEHPVIRYYQQIADGPAAKISDFLSQRQLHDLGLYQEGYRRFPVEFQMAIGLPSPPPLVVGIALNRSCTDFSDRDRLLLDLARPHLIRAYRNAETLTRLREGVEASGLGLVLVDREGRVRFATAPALRWIRRYFPGGAQGASDLPNDLMGWVHRQQQEQMTSAGVARPRDRLVVEGEEGRLTVRFLPDGKSAEQGVLLFEERSDVSPKSLASLGVSRREAEVLTLVARGSTDAEIAHILFLSPSTVHKHLEHIRLKLGVETRTGAAAKAFEATRGV